MRASTFPRRLAALALGLAVAGSMLAAPASAESSYEPEWLTDLSLKEGSVWEGYGEAQFAMMIHNACGAKTPYVTTSSVDDITYQAAGEVAEALLISASIDLDGVSDRGFLSYDKVCTFAVIETDIAGPHAVNLAGSYSLRVSSPIDSPQTVSAAFGPSYTAVTTPVFTDVDEYATASLTSRGTRVVQELRVVTVPGTPKTAAEVQRAKRAYDNGLKRSKKAYDKSVKKAKALKDKRKRAKARLNAKKRYTVSKRDALRSYRFAVATPSSKTTRSLVPVPTAFGVSLFIDGTIYPEKDTRATH